MRQDFLVNDDGTLKTENGDFAIGQSDDQHVGDIFLLLPGELKEFPVMGFGAIRYVKRNISTDEFKRDLKIQLQYDGYPDADIDTSNGIENLTIDI